MRNKEDANAVRREKQAETAQGEYLGTSTVGSSEACMLAGMAINFSRSASQIVGQYYNFLRLGWEGYRLTHLRTLAIASSAWTI